MNKMKRIIIVGGGVIGTLIAKELTKYNCDVILLEKENDVSMGASKANSGIVHAGFDAAFGSEKARFNIEGSSRMEQLCQELSVHYKKNGALVVAFDDEQLKAQKDLYEQGLKNGVKELYLISGEEARAMEPCLSPDIKGALWAETSAIVCPYTLTSKAAESAVKNGAAIYTNREVTDIVKENGKFTVICANEERFTAEFVVNAAGIHADEIAGMVGDNSFSIRPRRGEYMLFDKKLGGLVKHTIFQMPKKGVGKGVLITPTVDGNLLVGPTALDLSENERGSTETTIEGQNAVLKSAKMCVPEMSLRGLITSFAGLRAVSDNDDFIIKQSDAAENFINVAGMQSPGLSAAPYVGEYVASLIMKNKSARKEIIPVDAAPLREGNIVCRCETVSEGEIIDSIHRCCGSTDVDGVKRRTRAGMGRCQGGFCMPGVMEILARETSKDYDEITKKGKDSVILEHTR